MKLNIILANLFFIALAMFNSKATATSEFNIDSLISHEECVESKAVKKCWDVCAKQGFADPSAVCASRCGVSTNEGAEACWDICTKQGFSDPSAVCVSRCGLGQIKKPMTSNPLNTPACGMAGASCSGPFDCCSGSCVNSGCT